MPEAKLFLSRCLTTTTVNIVFCTPNIPSTMNIKKLHYLSGLILSLFVGLHLFNHAWSLLGAEQHIALMNSLRLFYRHILVEIMVITAVFIQILSGIQLFKKKVKSASSRWEKLHVWTGLYLAVFLVIHLGAVLVGRFVLQLDTNFYFGVAGLNSFPVNLFFIPYYALAILSFFGHVAAIHRQKMQYSIAGISPDRQAAAILLLGMGLTLLIFYGLTNYFNGVDVPVEYHILIGK